MRLLTLLLCCSLWGCSTIKEIFIAREIRSGVEALLPETDTELSDLGNGLYSLRWMVYRTAFLFTPKNIVLFEPLNKGALAQLQLHLDTLAPGRTITHVIYTHHHEDHISGAEAIPGKPLIYAHKNTLRDMQRWPHEHSILPNQVFAEDKLLLEIDGRGHVHEWKADEFCEAPGLGLEVQHKTVFVSDLIFPGSIPPVGMPFTSYHGMLQAIDQVQALNYQRLIPSHGKLGVREDVEEYRNFLHDADQALREALAAEGIQELHEDRTLFRESRFGELIFAAQDRLRPNYGHLQAFEEQAFPPLQWVLFHAVMMNE